MNDKPKHFSIQYKYYTLIMFDDFSNIDFEDDLLKTTFCTNSNVLLDSKPKKFSYPIKEQEPPFVNNKQVLNDIHKSPIEGNDRKSHKRKLSLESSPTFQSNHSFEDCLYNEVVNDPQFRDHSLILKSYNIDWIKENAKHNQLPGKKAPFLVATLNNLEIFVGKYPIINVKLKDVTGEINATIAHKLYEEYTDNLVNGSCIVIKEFGVLKTGMQQSFCIAITPHNLVAIYSRKDSKVHKIQVQNWDCKRLVNPAVYETNLNRKETQKPNYFSSNQNKSSKSLFQETNTRKKSVNKVKWDLFSVNDELDLSLNDNVNETPNNVIESKKGANNSLSIDTKSPEQEDVWKRALEDIDINDFLDDF